MSLIVSAISDIVNACRDTEDGAPYFMYGSAKEINARLINKSKGKATVAQKYPLIALIIPFPENDIDSGLIGVELNMAILNNTKLNTNAEEKIQGNLKTVLTPLYEKLLYNIRISGKFTWNGNQEKPPHEKFTRPFWGFPEDDMQKTIFTDPLDAIELVNLKINYINF
jgi:hypothetical protein